MKRFVAAALALCIGFAVMPLAAQALTVFSFSDGGGDGFGSQNVVGDTFELDLTGNDNGASAVSTSFSATATQNGVITVNWSYESRDRDGANWDRAGYRLNGVEFQLSDNSGSAFQNGTNLIIPLFVDDVIEFYVYSVDGGLGPADFFVEATFSVPLPASSALLGSTILGLALRRRFTS